MSDADHIAELTADVARLTRERDEYIRQCRGALYDAQLERNKASEFFAGKVNAEARVAELEAALREALRFVTPSVSLVLKEWSGDDESAKEKCQDIRDTRDRLAAVLKGE